MKLRAHNRISVQLKFAFASSRVQCVVGLVFIYSLTIRCIFRESKMKKNLNKKHVNPESHIAFAPISQSSFFKKVCCLILASSQSNTWNEYIEILKFDITIKKIRKSEWV